MKAAVLESYGPADTFKIKNINDPKISDGQILVRNRSTSVNPVDTIVRSGKFRIMSGLFGEHVIGSDFCGEVVLSKSLLFKKGDEVYGFNRAIKGGAYAELVVVNAQEAAIKPNILSYTEAASLPLVATTAWQGLVKLGKLRKGQNILINGCTGGVGSAAVQIAKTFNATITGVCNGKYADYAMALGCDKVIDYKQEKIPTDIQYDLVFDCAGKLTISDVKRSLKKGGMFVTTKGNLDSAGGMFRTALDLLFNSHMKFVVLKPSGTDLAHLRELIEQGKLKPHVHQVFPLEQISVAHKMVENESFPGKIAVEIK
jgi:NADPH:quinone reductase-like Zn-dependent oxidoreductase